MSPKRKYDPPVVFTLDGLDAPEWIERFKSLRDKDFADDWEQLIADGCDPDWLTIHLYFATASVESGGGLDQQVADLMSLADEIDRLLLRPDKTLAPVLIMQADIDRGYDLLPLLQSLPELGREIREFGGGWKKTFRQMGRSNSALRFTSATNYVNLVTGRPHHPQVSRLIGAALHAHGVATTKPRGTTPRAMEDDLAKAWRRAKSKGEWTDPSEPVAKPKRKFRRQK